jgi:hypothetical protein
MNGIYAFAVRIPWNLCLCGKDSVGVGSNDSKQLMELWNLCLRGKGSMDSAWNLCLCGKDSNRSIDVG